MVEFGNLLTDIGYVLTPFSFFMYLFIRPILFIMKSNAYKVVKAIWYFSMGMGLLVGEPKVDRIVMLLAFIEAYDLVFQYYEDKRSAKSVT
ncbi:hypothetical protein B0H99_101387 [Planomicrobium soli]|uniref:Uncharacterized protein n=1 Tax=Planomicrobium soli TaxID=1176648 RepID=A0A2P8H7F5_9BACL|nr:hypothetical protein [Planomicrobium soli]PSL42139.1 hypothetical protein B0H99_101387 [Planomicrobium soli]